MAEDFIQCQIEGNTMWFYLPAALKSQSGVCEKSSQPHPGSHMRARVPRPPIQCWDVRDWSQGPADDCFFRTRSALRRQLHNIARGAWGRKGMESRWRDVTVFFANTGTPQAACPP